MNLSAVQSKASKPRFDALEHVTDLLRQSQRSMSAWPNRGGPLAAPAGGFQITCRVVAVVVASDVTQPRALRLTASCRTCLASVPPGNQSAPRILVGTSCPTAHGPVQTTVEHRHGCTHQQGLQAQQPTNVSAHPHLPAWRVAHGQDRRSTRHRRQQSRQLHCLPGHRELPSIPAVIRRGALALRLAQFTQPPPLAS